MWAKWQITNWLSPPADHSYTNFQIAKKFKVNQFLLGGLLAFLGRIYFFKVWKHFPNLFKHALPMSAEVISDIFWFGLDQVPETISVPIKRKGWIRIYSLNTTAVMIWFKVCPYLIVLCAMPEGAALETGMRRMREIWLSRSQAGILISPVQIQPDNLSYIGLASLLYPLVICAGWCKFSWATPALMGLTQALPQRKVMLKKM